MTTNKRQVEKHMERLPKSNKDPSPQKRTPREQDYESHTTELPDGVGMQSNRQLRNSIKCNTEDQKT